MAQETSLSILPASSRLTPPRLDTVSQRRRPQGTVDDEAATIKYQFRRAYRNLRCVVLDLLTRDWNGLMGRRKSPEDGRRSQSQRGSKTSHSRRGSQVDDVQKKSGENSRGVRETRELNPRTVIDTLSTIWSSCHDDEYGDRDPLLWTMTALVDDTAAMVRPGLYISGFLAEQNRDQLQNKGITHILQLGENLTQSYRGDFEYKTLFLADLPTADILPVFREGLEYLDNCISNDGAALVHCYAGISRSATICIAYLMWRENLSLGAAYSVVHDARSVVQPNDGFRIQLQIFESLGADLGKLDEYLVKHPPAMRHRHSEFSSDDWESML